MKTKLKPIKSTNWARRFKRGMGEFQSKEALEIDSLIKSEKGGGVELYHNNDNGEWLWSIVPYWDDMTNKYMGY